MAMRWACLIIIIVGAFIGAMLPSSPSAAPDPSAIDGSSRESMTATARSAASYSANTSISLPAKPGQATILNRDPGGHFYADAFVNGTTVRFLVDTGATGVALTIQDAQRVGLPFFPGEFTTVGRGASGDVRGKHVTLDRVSLGGREVERVSGAIIEGGDISLLGQSFLSKMGTIEISGDQMVIR